MLDLVVDSVKQKEALQLKLEPFPGEDVHV